MLSTSKRFAVRLLILGVAVAPLLTGGGARADDPSAPPAPTNVPSPPPSELQGPAPSGAAAADAETARQEAKAADFGASTPVPPEPTFRAETRRMSWPNVPLLATGAVFFGAAYVPAVVGAAVSERQDDLYIPVAGPWLSLRRGPEEEAGDRALLAIDGAVQGLGALMLLSSFFIPERVTQHWLLIGARPVQVSASRLGTGYGLRALARF